MNERALGPEHTRKKPVRLSVQEHCYCSPSNYRSMLIQFWPDRYYLNCLCKDLLKLCVGLFSRGVTRMRKV